MWLDGRICGLTPVDGGKIGLSGLNLSGDNVDVPDTSYNYKTRHIIKREDNG